MENSRIDGKSQDVLVNLALAENLKSGASLADFKSVEEFLMHGVMQHFKSKIGNIADDESLVRPVLQSLMTQYEKTFNQRINQTPMAMKNPNPLNMRYKVYYGGGKLEIYSKDFRHDDRFLREFQASSSPYPPFALDHIDPKDPPLYAVWFSIQDGNRSTWHEAWEFYKMTVILRSDIIDDPNACMTVSREVMKYFDALQYMIINGIIDKNEELPDVMNSPRVRDLVNIDFTTLCGPFNVSTFTTRRTTIITPAKTPAPKMTRDESPKEKVPVRAEISEVNSKEELKQEEVVEESEPSHQDIEIPNERSLNKEIPAAGPIATLEDVAPLDTPVKASSFKQTEIRAFTSAVFDLTSPGFAHDLWPRLRAMETGEIIMFLRGCRYRFCDEDIMSRMEIIFKKDHMVMRKILKRAHIVTTGTKSSAHTQLMDKFYQFVFRDETFITKYNLVDCRKAICTLRRSDIQILLKWAYECRKEYDTTYSMTNVNHIRSMTQVTGVDEEFIVQAFIKAGFQFAK